MITAFEGNKQFHNDVCDLIRSLTTDEQKDKLEEYLKYVSRLEEAWTTLFLKNQQLEEMIEKYNEINK